MDWFNRLLERTAKLPTQLSIEEIETDIREEYLRVLGNGKDNKVIRDLNISAAAKRVAAGEKATIEKQGEWVVISFGKS